MQKMKSHTFNMYCYFSVNFNDISENKKIRLLLNLRNQNGTHHAMFAYNKFQAQLSKVMEWLVSNVMTNFRPPIKKLFCHYALLSLGTPDTLSWKPVSETLP